MDNTIKRTINATSVFGRYYLDSKSVYMYFFNDVPCISFINQLDGEKAFAAVKEKYAPLIETTYQYRQFEPAKKKIEFDRTLSILSNGCIIEFDAFYCEVLHNYESSVFVDEVVEYIRPYREKKRRKPLEINLVMRTGNYLDLKSMEISKTKLDLDMFYEDDFKETDAIIRARLSKKKDFLNVQIICTFNSALTMVDDALLRKGRLIARYEFGKLGIAKAQRLSDHFGFNTTINKPMTVAEVTNQHEKLHEAKRVEVIGFRRNFLEN